MTPSLLCKVIGDHSYKLETKETYNTISDQLISVWPSFKTSD